MCSSLLSQLPGLTAPGLALGPFLFAVGKGYQVEIWVGSSWVGGTPLPVGGEAVQLGIRVILWSALYLPLLSIYFLLVLIVLPPSWACVRDTGFIQQAGFSHLLFRPSQITG